MLSHYLKCALNDLDALISMTNEDIVDIKEAKHEVLFERSKEKEKAVASFENYKQQIDTEISALMQQNPSTDLSALLNDEQHAQLDALKEKLLKLKQANKRYAKLTLAVSEFFSSLLDRVIPTEMQGYEKVASGNSSFLKIRV